MPQLGLGLGLHRANRALFRGLLDQYAGAAAAYSLRALSSGWLAGDVVEVRRSSFGGGDAHDTFTASQITSGAMLAWVTEFSGTADGFVSKWYDQSGNGNDAIQPATTQQPKIVSAGALVTGGLEFDGVDDVLSVVDSFANSQGLSLFLVANIPDGQGASIMVRHGQANPENAWNFQIASDSGNPLGLIRCSDGTISTGSTEKYITSGGVVDNFGSLSLYGANHANGFGREILVNGTSLSLSKPFGTDQSSTFNSSEVMSIGANSNGTSPVAGIFGELIVYDSDESANRAAIETNINAAYSIYA